MPHATASDGTRIAYQVQGGNQPPLLLLAGQANNHHWWDVVRGDFHQVRRTITLDYRGTGQSDKPDVPYSTRGFAEDAIAVLDDLGIGQADVYGTSMGGRVAQWVAADHQHRVRRLVLGCTTPGGPRSVQPDPAVAQALYESAAGGFEQALTELMYTPAWLAEHPGPYGTLGDPDMPPHARRRHRIASRRHDAWKALPRIKAPTLVLHGTEDTFNPAANAPLLADRIPEARLSLIPGARHAYFEECRALASSLVVDFLDAELHGP